MELKNELGDLFFQVVYLSQIASEKNKFNFFDIVRKLKFHPEIILNRANKKFENRWRKIEKIAKTKKNLNNLNSEKLNQYWQISKK